MMLRRAAHLVPLALFILGACAKDEVGALGDTGVAADAEGTEDAAEQDAGIGDDAGEDAGEDDAGEDDAGELDADRPRRDGGMRRDGGGRDGGGRDGGPAGPDSGVALVPLTDMGRATYLGFSGGLYPNVSNTAPAGHAAEGLLRANRIEPRDLQGAPSTLGKVVLLSIGMSNTTQEFCSQGGALPCATWSFMGQAATSTIVDTTALVIANGALGGRDASFWDSPIDPDYDRVRDSVLVPQGLSEAQVQIAWVKVANARPTVSLPAPEADAYELEGQIANIARSMRIRYPNLEQIFLSSRIYAGYATTPLNPEPYAYESGFGVKWVIEAQITQAQTGTISDARAGDLAYASSPWLAWGPYLWADGTTPRSDGLTWSPDQFQNDGTHPGRSAEEVVGGLLLRFFTSSQFTRCWFTTAGTCP